MTDTEILELIDRAFGQVEKPEHFTDYKHCEECAEHDETLRSHDRGTLTTSHIDNPGWNPLCFSTAQGLAYYAPTLARFLLEPSTSGGALLNVLFILTSGGPYNKALQYCSVDQRTAVATLLAHIIETRAEHFSAMYLDDDLCAAHTLWSAS